MGAITLLLAASQEPDIKAIVVDSAYPDIIPILQREIPKQAGLPSFLTPGALLADRLLYGIDWYDVKPGDVVASLAPRPLFSFRAPAINTIHRTILESWCMMPKRRRTPRCNHGSFRVPGTRSPTTWRARCTSSAWSPSTTRR